MRCALQKMIPELPLSSSNLCCFGFQNIALDTPGAQRQIIVAHAFDEDIKAAIMINTSQGTGTDLQLERPAQNVTCKSDIAQVGTEGPACPVLRVTHIVTGHNTLAGQFAAPRHFETLLFLRNEPSIKPVNPSAHL